MTNDQWQKRSPASYPARGAPDLRGWPAGAGETDSISTRVVYANPDPGELFDVTGHIPVQLQIAALELRAGTEHQFLRLLDGDVLGRVGRDRGKYHHGRCNYSNPIIVYRHGFARKL